MMRFAERFGRREMLVSLGIFLVVVFCLFANTLGNEWTLDDFPVVVNNPDIRSLKGFVENVYPGRPLRELTYLIDYTLFGLKPAGYHLQHIFWHGLNAFLIFVLVRRLRGRKAVAWAASLFFLAHPLVVEVVGNISHRKDSLALAFSLLSFLAYIEVFNPGRKKVCWLAVSIVLWGVALLAKKNALALPLVWLAYETTFLSPEQRVLLRKKRVWPCFFGGGLLVGTWWYLFHGGQGIHMEAIRPLMAKMDFALPAGSVEPYYLLVFKSLSFMFLKFLLPTNLAPEYVYSVPEKWTDPWVVSALCLILIYAASLWGTVRRCPLAFWALVWLGAFYLPVSNLWPLSYFAADRYLYSSLVGGALIGALLMEYLFGRIPLLRNCIFIFLLVMLASLTWKQNQVWQSRLNLWTQAVKVSPDSTTALNNLGGVYLQREEFEKSLEFFHKAAHNFNNPLPYYNLGRVYEKMGNRDKALFYYRNFLAFNDPGYSEQAMKLRLNVWRKYGVRL